MIAPSWLMPIDVYEDISYDVFILTLALAMCLASANRTITNMIQLEALKVLAHSGFGLSLLFETLKLPYEKSRASMLDN